MALKNNELEAANRAEVTALLIRSGFRVYRPQADVNGEDLVIRDSAGELRSVQLKSRPCVDWNRYGNRQTWMLFPDPPFKQGRDWFLIDHDQLFAQVKGWHSNAPAWKNLWSYPTVPKRLKTFLAPFTQVSWSADGLSNTSPLSD